MLGQLISAIADKIGLGGQKAPEQTQQTSTQPSQAEIAAMADANRQLGNAAAAPMTQINTSEVEAKIQAKIAQTNQEITDLENQAKAKAEQAQKEIEALKTQITTTAGSLPTDAQGNTQSVEEMMKALNPAQAPQTNANPTGESPEDMAAILKMMEGLGLGGEQAPAQTETTPAVPQNQTQVNQAPVAMQNPGEMSEQDLAKLLEQLGLGGAPAEPQANPPTTAAATPAADQAPSIDLAGIMNLLGMAGPAQAQPGQTAPAKQAV